MSSGMSSRRSRSDGTVIGTTSSRKYQVLAELALLDLAPQILRVAATTRMSTLIVFAPPTRRSSRCSSTRRSFG